MLVVMWMYVCVVCRCRRLLSVCCVAASLVLLHYFLQAWFFEGGDVELVGYVCECGFCRPIQ